MLKLVNAKTGAVQYVPVKGYVPEFVQRENTSKGWVNAGKNNLYFKELVDLVDGSGIASACIDTKANFIRGEGWVWDEKNQFEDLLYKRLTNDNFLEKVGTDLSYFEGKALNIRYNANCKITEIKHVDFSACRLGIADEFTREITKVYVCADWKQVGKKGYEAIELPIFNPDPKQIKAEMKKYGKEYKGQILYIRKYKPGNFYYRQPTWAASDDRLDIDRQIGEFHVENLENGLFPGMVMYMPGEDWEDVVGDTGRKKKDLYEEFQRETLAGKGKKGKVLNTYGKDKESAPQILPFQQNANEGMFMALNDQTVKYIPSAFQVPPLLAGIKMEGTSLAADQIANQIELFQNGVIAPHQLTITDTLNRLMPLMEGYKGKVAYPVIQNRNPLNYIPESYLDVLTPNEKRERIGYKKSNNPEFDKANGFEIEIKTGTELKPATV